MEEKIQMSMRRRGRETQSLMSWWMWFWGLEEKIQKSRSMRRHSIFDESIEVVLGLGREDTKEHEYEERKETQFLRVSRCGVGAWKKRCRRA